MKRADIKVGEEYAVGPTSSYGRPCRVVVRELVGERTVKRNWGGTEVKRGVVVEVIESPYSSPKPGDEVVHPSREILRAWDEHARNVAASAEATRVREAERQRCSDLSYECQIRLHELGFGSGDISRFSDKECALTPDAMTRLLAMVPDGTTRGATR